MTGIDTEHVDTALQPHDRGLLAIDTNPEDLLDGVESRLLDLSDAKFSSFAERFDAEVIRAGQYNAEIMATAQTVESVKRQRQARPVQAETVAETPPAQ